MRLIISTDKTLNDKASIKVLGNKYNVPLTKTNRWKSTLSTPKS